MSLEEQVARWRSKIEARVTPEAAAPWVTVALDRASYEAAKHLGPATGDLVAQALDELRPVAPAIARRGVSAFRGALSSIFAEDPKAARKAWIELAEMTPEERRARLRDSIVKADDAVSQAEKDFDELMEAIGRAGTAALKVAIPLILAAL